MSPPRVQSGCTTTSTPQGGLIMSQPITGQAITQFGYLFRSLVLDPALLYAQILSTEIIAEVVLQEVGQTDDRIFTPLVTLATFLFQVLSDDHSCRNAVARLRA